MLLDCQGGNPQLPLGKWMHIPQTGWNRSEFWRVDRSFPDRGQESCSRWWTWHTQRPGFPPDVFGQTHWWLLLISLGWGVPLYSVKPWLYLESVLHLELGDSVLSFIFYKPFCYCQYPTTYKVQLALKWSGPSSEGEPILGAAFDIKVINYIIDTVMVNTCLSSWALGKGSFTGQGLLLSSAVEDFDLGLWGS